MTINIRNFMTVLLLSGCVAITALHAATPVPECLESNKPVGTPRGIHPGRVAWSHAPGAASWDGGDGIWFDDKYNNQTACNWLMDRTLMILPEKKRRPRPGTRYSGTSTPITAKRTPDIVRL